MTDEEFLNFSHKVMVLIPLAFLGTTLIMWLTYIFTDKTLELCQALTRVSVVYLLIGATYNFITRKELSVVN